MSDRDTLITDVNKGEFWKPCPGTSKEYFCCGYQIITPLTGCGMYCSYCILQAYFGHSHQVHYSNFEDLQREVAQKMEGRKGIVRFGTGEFADSLYQEDNLGLCKKIAALLQPYDNVLVEFKTKSTCIDTLYRIEQPGKVVIGFSLNTDRMIRSLEEKTASLIQRLEAAQKCEKMGFYLAFHFDPMVWHREWETEYRNVVRIIFDYIEDPKKIAWCSMGGFRTMPSLKGILRKEGKDLPLFSGEMIHGADGKLRYPRPLRVKFYRAMKEEFEKFDPDITLYMCMESREVWEASGMITRIPGGLKKYLDLRANEILRGG
ncbi:DNA repair photolyase-like protein [Chitinispirillum alkaliphilum]|nr:DNA repair photolyase-like protein [Chitinispirillum alkaliphilum]